MSKRWLRVAACQICTDEDIEKIPARLLIDCAFVRVNKWMWWHFTKGFCTAIATDPIFGHIWIRGGLKKPSNALYKRVEKRGLPRLLFNASKRRTALQQFARDRPRWRGAGSLWQNSSGGGTLVRARATSAHLPSVWRAVLLFDLSRYSLSRTGAVAGCGRCKSLLFLQL